MATVGVDPIGEKRLALLFSTPYGASTENRNTGPKTHFYATLWIFEFQRETQDWQVHLGIRAKLCGDKPLWNTMKTAMMQKQGTVDVGNRRRRRVQKPRIPCAMCDRVWLSDVRPRSQIVQPDTAELSNSTSLARCSTWRRPMAAEIRCISSGYKVRGSFTVPEPL